MNQRNTRVAVCRSMNQYAVLAALAADPAAWRDPGDYPSTAVCRLLLALADVAQVPLVGCRLLVPLAPDGLRRLRLELRLGVPEVREDGFDLAGVHLLRELPELRLPLGNRLVYLLRLLEVLKARLHLS